MGHLDLNFYYVHKQYIPGQFYREISKRTGVSDTDNEDIIKQDYLDFSRVDFILKRIIDLVSNG